MCMIDFAERAAVYSHTSRVAVIEHTCEECNRIIARRERYRVTNGLWDGQWSYYKTCAHCAALWKWFDVVCGGTLHGALADDLREHWDEYGQLNLGRLVIGMRRDWHGWTVDDVTRAVDGNAMYREYATD